MAHRSFHPLLLSAALLPLLGCQSDKGADSWDSANWRQDDDGEWDAPADEADTGEDYAPEEEQDFLMLHPAATELYVFVANPERDTVTRIKVDTLDVRTKEVGVRPEIVVASADWATALTLNSGSDDVSIIDADTFEIRNVEVRPNLNALDLSPDGRWAVAWHDADVVDTGPASSEVRSYNEISILDAVGGIAYEAVVGINPRDVVFSDDGALALVVSDESLAAIDLSGETPRTSMVPLSDDLVNPPPAEETVIAANGRYAFVRQFGANSILIVDLETLTTTEVPVGRNPTDLDLTPDGRQFVVVTRTDSRLWIFDADDPYAEPVALDMLTDLSSAPVLGSLLFSPDGRTALLYSNATPQDVYVTWDLETWEFRERPLIKPVQTMSISPDGESLLVFHTLGDAADASRDTAWYGRWAMTLVDMRDFRSNPLVLAAEPTAYAHSADGHYGFFIMESQAWFQVLDYDTLMCDSLPLGSLPVHVGALPYSSFAYVSQDHDLGRISFYNTTDGSVQTMTGFELNAGIESD